MAGETIRGMSDMFEAEFPLPLLSPPALHVPVF